MLDLPLFDKLCCIFRDDKKLTKKFFYYLDYNISIIMTL